MGDVELAAVLLVVGWVENQLVGLLVLRYGKHERPQVLGNLQPPPLRFGFPDGTHSTRPPSSMSRATRLRPRLDVAPDTSSKRPERRNVTRLRSRQCDCLEASRLINPKLGFSRRLSPDGRDYQPMDLRGCSLVKRPNAHSRLATHQNR